MRLLSEIIYVELIDDATNRGLQLVPFLGRVIPITDPDEPNAPEGQPATKLNALRFIPREPRQILHEKDIESACFGIV
jgi:hypothetical protein